MTTAQTPDTSADQRSLFADQTALDKQPDYMDQLLQDAAYEIIRREGFYKSLENGQWDAASVELASRLRPHVENYLALIAAYIEDPPV